MSEKKPVILQFSRTRNNCPVCGKPSYSANGMHPQCAVTRFDDLTRDDRKKAHAANIQAKRKSWCKTCPKCRQEIPARRVVCNCGHQFSIGQVAATKNRSLDS